VKPQHELLDEYIDTVCRGGERLPAGDSALDPELARVADDLAGLAQGTNPRPCFVAELETRLGGEGATAPAAAPAPPLDGTAKAGLSQGGLHALPPQGPNAPVGVAQVSGTARGFGLLAVARGLVPRGPVGPRAHRGGALTGTSQAPALQDRHHISGPRPAPAARPDVPPKTRHPFWRAALLLGRAAAAVFLIAALGLIGFATWTAGRPYIAGWIGPNVSADPRQAVVELDFDSGNGRVLQAGVSLGDGQIVTAATWAEGGPPFAKIEANWKYVVAEAEVVKVDRERGLALLRTRGALPPTPGPTGRLAAGDRVQLVGREGPATLPPAQGTPMEISTLTLREGQGEVVATGVALPDPRAFPPAAKPAAGPFVAIRGETWQGLSGGLVLDAQGRPAAVVALVQMLTSGAPGTVYALPLDEAKNWAAGVPATVTPQFTREQVIEKARQDAQRSRPEVGMIEARVDSVEAELITLGEAQARLGDTSGPGGYRPGTNQESPVWWVTVRGYFRYEGMPAPLPEGGTASPVYEADEQRLVYYADTGESVMSSIPNRQVGTVVPQPATKQLDDPVYRVALAYPDSWQPVAGYSERYGGSDGFFQISALGGGDWTLAQACENDASHKLQPYGTDPRIEYIQVGGRDACAIWPSADQDPSMENLATALVAYPRPVEINGNAYAYFVLAADKDHLLAVASSLRFADEATSGTPVAVSSGPNITYRPPSPDGKTLTPDEAKRPVWAFMGEEVADLEVTLDEQPRLLREPAYYVRRNWRDALGTVDTYIVDPKTG